MSTAYPFWLGGAAASMAASCTHPLDLIKVRMQTLDPKIKRPSALIVLRKAITNSGVRSLFTGLSASLMRQMSYSLVRIGTYEEMKRRILEKGKTRGTTFKLLLAASLAGGLGGIAGNPADIVLVRMISDSVKPQELRYGYRNALVGLFSLIKEEGINGLARGLGTNTTRAILMNASQVGSYDFFKSQLLGRTLPFTENPLRDNLPLHFLASSMAGAFATTICSPADVLKSRLMSQSTDVGLIQLLRKSLREEGPSFLFKGWTPAFVRLGPNTVLLFIFLEQIKKGWSTLHSA